MEVWQHMELTDTKEPCGLTIFFFKQSLPCYSICHRIIYTDIFGGHSEEAPPVPIPNTEVKLFSADGTARETVWESRSPPIPFQNPQSASLVGGFCVGEAKIFFGVKTTYSSSLPDVLLTCHSSPKTLNPTPPAPMIIFG